MRTTALSLAGLFSLATFCSAAAGECYRRVVEPPRYRAVEEQVLVEPERVVPEYVPAVEREVEETVVVRPEHEVRRVVAAEYGYRDETALVSPAHRVFELRERQGEQVGCWVTVPATYARRARRVLLRPEREVTQIIPAVVETRVRHVVVEPARNLSRVIPARYALRARKELVSGASDRWAPVPDVCAD